MPRQQLVRLTASRHLWPVLFLVALAFGYWARVLVTPQVLLPGEFLRGFAPFGADAQAPWNLLQWDALGQYYPWRVFAARELQSGLVPLWNPHQFSGAPFVANGQSAVFYPFNLPFWVFDVAWAFGFSAFLHTLLATLGTYALLQQWKLSRAASVLGAIVFGYCGYFAAWVMLPTLANTASSLPLCLLLFERAAAVDKRSLPPRICWLALALACALLAGHAQVFFYIVVALAMRALFWTGVGRALSTLIAAGALCVLLAAIQVLPTLELARLGHRAGGSATIEGWNFLVPRALQFFELPGLFIPQAPTFSFSENFGYVGMGVLVLAVVALIGFATERAAFDGRRMWFALSLAAFGILYALATPLAQAFYFTVPGLSQMGGVGRALILWSCGAALLAALGFHVLQRKVKFAAVPVVAVIVIAGELVAAGIGTHRTAPREIIYPPTAATEFLRANTRDGARVLFITPRKSWLPGEVLQQSGRSHPSGALPPNGAMVYGLFDVAGYDSLAPRAYREFLAQGEGTDVSPPLNGNMILLENLDAPTLDALGVRYVVSQGVVDAPRLIQVLYDNGTYIYERTLPPASRRDGSEFSPGLRDGHYQPQSFRLGVFISLVALGLVASVVSGTRRSAKRSTAAVSNSTLNRNE